MNYQVYSADEFGETSYANAACLQFIEILKSYMINKNVRISGFMRVKYFRDKIYLICISTVAELSIKKPKLFFKI